MPVDWNEFNDNVDAAIAAGAQRADDQTIERIAAITRMTDEEIKELFPEPADVKKLGELIAIVKSAEDRNVKIARIVENAEQLGGVMLTLIARFA